MRCWGRVAPGEGWHVCVHGAGEPASHHRVSLGACGAQLLYFQDATTVLLGNRHVAQPIRVTFEREQVGCWETGPAKQAWQLASPNSQCALGNFLHARPCHTLCTRATLSPRSEWAQASSSHRCRPRC